ncbi:MAG: SpoIIE family protein phosphatase [Nitrospirae bacterium]|nr:SpoIIE family protein phosphatase [Nitrospirota bacterium]
MTKKILVVDDEPDLEELILQKFRRKIRSNEFEFLFARNGLEALAKLQGNDVDMVLTDINMPEMDGLTLLEELLKLPTLTKAVVVSAYGDMNNIRTAMNRGAFDFVTKPIDFRDLELTIDKTLSELKALKDGRRASDTLNALQQEMELAGRLQQTILPKFCPIRDDMALFTKMAPAKDIGGDFFDYFFIDEDHLGVVIADVSGKGVTAAMFMAVSRTLLRFTALQGTDVVSVLAHVNNLLCIDNDMSMFVTVFYGILDLKKGEFRYANGGHFPAIRMSGDGKIEFLPQTRGIALGVMEGMEFEEGRVGLSDGDLLYLFTDGISEAENPNGEFFETQRLMDYLTGQLIGMTPERIVTGVHNAVKEFAGAAEQFDDMTQLALQYRPGGNQQG